MTCFLYALPTYNRGRSIHRKRQYNWYQSQCIRRCLRRQWLSYWGWSDLESRGIKYQFHNSKALKLNRIKTKVTEETTVCAPLNTARAMRGQVERHMHQNTEQREILRKFLPQYVQLHPCVLYLWTVILTFVIRDSCCLKYVASCMSISNDRLNSSGIIILRVYPYRGELPPRPQELRWPGPLLQDLLVRHREYAKLTRRSVLMSRLSYRLKSLIKCAFMQCMHL